MKPCDAPKSLFKATMELLGQDKRPLFEIAVATNVPYHWLAQVKAGNVKSPSVNRIQYLYEALSGKQLVL